MTSRRIAIPGSHRPDLGTAKPERRPRVRGRRRLLRSIYKVPDPGNDRHAFRDRRITNRHSSRHVPGFFGFLFLRSPSTFGHSSHYSFETKTVSESSHKRFNKSGLSTLNHGTTKGQCNFNSLGIKHPTGWRPGDFGQHPDGGSLRRRCSTSR
jgi:hypothetical protein